jgi:hypothetical protein
MPRRPWGHRGQPTGLAKPGGTRAHRCSSVSACGGLGASPYASACALASGVIVWPPRARLRHGWREVWRGGVGWWRRVRPRVAALWACGWSPRATWAPASRAPGPYGRPAKPGGSSHSPCPGWERNRGGPRRQRPAVGMGQASCGRGRSRIGSHGSCRKRCAWAGCMRVNWRRRKPRPLPLRQGKPLRPGPPTGGRGTPGGAPAGPMPRPPVPRRRAAGRGAAAAGRAPGGLTRAALASWQSAAARAAPGEDGQRRRPQPRPSPALAWWWRSRGGVIPRQTMAGRYSPRRCALRRGRLQRFSRPIKTKRPPWNLGVGGASPPRPSRPGGSRNPHGWPLWRCSPSSACWSPGACSGRCAGSSRRMVSRCQGTQARQRLRRRQWGSPCVPRSPWSNDGETIKGSRRGLVSKPITSCSVTRWGSTPHGMKCPQRTKTVGGVRPLDRGMMRSSAMGVKEAHYTAFVHS